MCNHTDVILINPYELIRKYKCKSCGEVMMCICDQEFALRFLPHQINEASEYGTRKTMPVTIGFQENICNTCRGLPEKVYPMAEIHGRTSKIQRYYWREIYFETTKRIAKWVDENNYSDLNIAEKENPETIANIRKDVLQEIKDLHKRSPKYTYQEESQSEVLKKNNVKIIDVDTTYVKTRDRKSKILFDGEIFTVEGFAINYFSERQYKTLVTESIPFHVIFGIFMWILIQDPRDIQVRVVGFGDRTAFDEGRKGEQIRIHLPDDFGSPGYAKRRADAIEKHFDTLPNNYTEFFWLFDYWVEHSNDFRQYLWAHRDEDVSNARELIKILPVEIIYRILKYLVEDYWGRYTGWPDLLVYNDDEYFFVEVKSSGDKLREDQKNWIYGNSNELKLPFYLMKLHKKHTVNDETA